MIKKNKKNNAVLRSLAGNTFMFRCHKDIECFTRCCAGLNLVLTPYDIVRIKNRLYMSSDDFLNKYTDTTMDRHPRFPMVKLVMKRDEKRRCPFVSPDGCVIYEDRPLACRIYPLGRATTKPDARGDTREKFFIVEEKHCMGFQEDRKWTVKEWLKNEGVDEYNAMNDKWLEIVTSKKNLGPEKGSQQKIQMFFMASYNLDKFRNFLFKSKFFDLFEVQSDLKDKLVADDVELMKFAFDWLKFSLFGEKMIQIKF